jgi:hypothetical protein
VHRSAIYPCPIWSGSARSPGGQEEVRFGLVAMFRKIDESAVEERTARTVGSFCLALLSGLMVQWLLDPERAPSGSDMAEALREIWASVRPSEQAPPPSAPPSTCPG